tara:strand:+ start:1296 stop:1517 length:222 start_codon:yes stop_codon:yes gene_type:complete
MLGDKTDIELTEEIKEAILNFPAGPEVTEGLDPEVRKSIRKANEYARMNRPTISAQDWANIKDMVMPEESGEE